MTMIKNKIKVLLVDDSMLFREGLARELSKDPELEIVAKAKDAFEARDYIVSHKPDVMTCDIAMPKMDGIEFVRRLIPQYPMPVIIVSSITDAVLDAMEAGALDFAAKPDGIHTLGLKKLVEDLIPKIKAAAKAKVSGKCDIKSKPTINKNYCFDNNKLIAIGASTGGTEALLRVLSSLPPNIPGIVVVQHMPPVFSKMFADRLNNQTNLEVYEAAGGEYIEKGTVYIAPGNKHMKIKKVGTKYKTVVYEGERVNGHCPSVDVLFSSVAKECNGKAVGVLLTGMGKDGANGLLEMKNKGAFTIGQDEKTSVVYGMPKVAYQIGAVTKQLSLDSIASAISDAVCKIGN